MAFDCVPVCPRHATDGATALVLTYLVSAKWNYVVEGQWECVGDNGRESAMQLQRHHVIWIVDDVYFRRNSTATTMVGGLLPYWPDRYKDRDATAPSIDGPRTQDYH